MSETSPATLVEAIKRSTVNDTRFIADRFGRIGTQDIAERTALSNLDLAAGRRVLLATSCQLSTVLALVALDGLAKRIVICTPDLSETQIARAVADADIDLIVTDERLSATDVGGSLPIARCGRDLPYPLRQQEARCQTEWVLFTSGTAGPPKLVRHSLETLATAAGHGTGLVTDSPIWSTFYDIRRYGGLQILLRALLGGGSMVLSDPAEAVADFLQRLQAARVTHISGTPSHWRLALMSGQAQAISPNYVRLSGEAADQAILDRLIGQYPGAKVSHAFASTEAGVAFDVRDGKAGFPASLLSDAGPIDLRVRDGALQIRSSRIAARYLGPDAPALKTEDGFVDTGDIVEQIGDRYFFSGRRSGIINVGGLKVHPEAVETVINRHPAVMMSKVSPRRSPIIGSIIVADIVLQDGEADSPTIRDDLAEFCRQSLPSHQMPVSFRVVTELAIGASGKVRRDHA